jgi:uncharacterized cofD-like protein
MENKKIVCLGGGIGTVNLLKGIRTLTDEVSVVVSMADEGGSSGRLRRLYDIQPPGDLISCMAALSDHPEGDCIKLLTYRFPGDRYGKDDSLHGQKLGNLMMVAAQNITGSFSDGVALLQKLFHTKGTILPATKESVSISALTHDGTEVTGEENIDLGKYDGDRVLDRVFLHPENPEVPSGVMDALEEADVIIAGPGDLYTTVLPVLIIPQIKEFLQKTDKKKIFVVNVANKPFETKGYAVSDFVAAIAKHMEGFHFDTVVVNNKTSLPIPEQYQYSYVAIDQVLSKIKLVAEDLVDDSFPLYHDPHKLAKVISKHI